MSFSSHLTKIKNREIPNDKIYTPIPLAKDMINICNITPIMKVLDPSRGGGAFYDNLPDCDKYYCEIDEGKDFFNFYEKMDLVIGNPPFSMWNKWIEHTMKITNKFCYIMSAFNLTIKRVNFLKENGWGITSITICNVSWWFGNNYIIIAEKNKPSIIDVLPEQYKCDVCNKNCGRGLMRKGVKLSPNKCALITDD